MSMFVCDNCKCAHEDCECGNNSSEVPKPLPDAKATGGYRVENGGIKATQESGIFGDAPVLTGPGPYDGRQNIRSVDPASMQIECDRLNAAFLAGKAEQAEQLALAVKVVEAGRAVVREASKWHVGCPEHHGELNTSIAEFVRHDAALRAFNSPLPDGGTHAAH